jgi:hypothetical protein
MALLAGACGHTYGNNNTWQMWQPGRQELFGARIPWYEALHHPGAYQMTHVRTLLESRPFQRLRPAQGMLLDAPTCGGAKARAARAHDGSFALVYSPQGLPVTVDLTCLSGVRIRQSWFDPRYGLSHPIHEGVKGILTFTPPTSGCGCDWLLVLDDVGEETVSDTALGEETVSDTALEGMGVDGAGIMGVILPDPFTPHPPRP